MKLWKNKKKKTESELEVNSLMEEVFTPSSNPPFIPQKEEEISISAEEPTSPDQQVLKCIDCIYCWKQNEPEHMCNRPMINPILGRYLPLNNSCMKERWGIPLYPFMNICGTQGVFFQKKDLINKN